VGTRPIPGRKGLTEFPVDISLSPLPSEQGTLLAAAIRDVTERRRLEELRDEFIRNAAHELRTPLATISTLGETLASNLGRLSEEQLAERAGGPAPPEPAREHARQQPPRSLPARRGEGRVELGPVNVAEAIALSLESAPPGEGTDVDVEVDDTLTVLADPSRLEQVVTNLLTNAYRYGGHRVRIEAEASDDHVDLRISDDGPGVPEELVEDLFEPFTRGRDAGDVGGSGIGLALSERLAETFGGSLSYEPGRPGGATFVCRLQRRT
jgi:signal transduction histidine kinase